MANLDKNSFVAGELSPRARSRTDLVQYGQGCRVLENCLVHPHGGVSNRPGTRYVGATKYPLKKARLIPFQYSTEAAYMIEAGDYYFRFWVNNARLEDGGSPVEIETPWDENDIFQLQWTQEADVQYLVHPDWNPRKHSRTSLVMFSLDEVTWNAGRAPLGPFNLDTTNKLVTNVAGTTYDRRITITNDAFVAADVGRVFYARNTSQKRASFYLVRQIVSAKIIEADDLHQDPASQHPTDTDLWALGLFSEGYGCNTITFHEGRLWFGGFKRQVDGIAGSVSDDFENFEIESPDPDVDDAGNADKAIFRRMVSNQVNAVNSLRSTSDTLIALTSGAEFRVRGDNEDSLTPSGTVVKFVSGRGSSQVPGVVVDDSLFFIQRSNTVLRKFGIHPDTLNLTSRNFSILSDHLLRTGGGITTLVHQAEPLGMLWMARKDGQGVSWTFEAEQQVSGPSRHIYGGSYLGGHAVVESYGVLEGQAPLNSRSDQTGFDGPITGSMTSPGFEAGSLTGWTTATGTWAAVASVGGVVPQEGSYLADNTSATADAEIYKDFDLTGLSGFNTILVEEGLTTLDVSIWITQYAAAEAQFIVEALNNAGESIAILYDTGAFVPTTNTWVEYADTGLELPPTTRTIRFRCIGSPTLATPAAGACFDNLTATVTQTPIVIDANTDGNADQLWQITKRTIDGSTVRYIEYMEVPWNEGTDTADETEEGREARRDRVDTAFFVDSGLSLDVPLQISDITRANPAVVTTVETHGLSNGDRVRLRNISGMTEVNQGQFIIANKTAYTFELTDLSGDDVDATAYGTFEATEDAAAYQEVQVLSGLEHLEGQEVALLVDGATHPPRVVSSGSVALARWGSLAHVGLPYVCEGETMGAFTSGSTGVDIGDPVKISHVTASMNETIGLKLGRGSNPENWEQIPATPDKMGRSPVPFTGFKKVPLGGRYDDYPSIRFRQELPLPFTLLALYIKYQSFPE